MIITPMNSFSLIQKMVIFLSSKFSTLSFFFLLNSDLKYYIVLYIEIKTFITLTICGLFKLI